MSSNISIDADFVINEQPDIQADLHINFSPDVSNFVTREELAEDLADKQDVLTAGDNIQIEDNVISATDTTYTAGEGISIVNNVISNTQTSAEWGNIEGDIAEQTDLIDLIDTKIDIEATARENNDLLLQNGINTLNDDLTAEISNRGTADGILQDNIDTLSGTVTSNYNTLDGLITNEATARSNADDVLDGKIGDNKTAIDNHKADKNNPHEVTKAQVGLGNCDNTSDLNKPISTATQNALDGKVPTSRTVNGKALTSDITLTASDVDALPDTTTIGNGTLTIQKNGSTIDSFGANDTGNTTVNITVPTDTSDLTNNAGYIKGINSTDVTNALGYTPYNSTNPDGYQENIIETIKVNNTAQTVTNKTVNITVPITASDVNALPDSTKYAASMNLSIDGSTYVISAQLKDQNGDNLGQAQTIDLPLESVVVSGSYDSTNKKVILTLKDGSTIEFSVADLVSGLQTEITASNKLDADLVDDSTSTNKFATASQLAQIGTNQTNIGTINTTIGGYGDIVTHDTDEFATSSQGDLADTAIQPTDLSTVATTGNYNDLTNKPTIPTNVSAFTNDAKYIQNTATGVYGLTIEGTASNNVSSINIGKNSLVGGGFCTVVGNDATCTGGDAVTIGFNATSADSSIAIGTFAKATGISSIQIGNGTNSTNRTCQIGDYRILDGAGKIPNDRIPSNIARTSDLATVATSGSYNDLSDKPTIPAAQVNSDWAETDTSSKAYIENKPTLSTVATTGDYDDLTNKPTIPAAQVQANWNETDTSSKAYIQNKPTIPSVGDGTITINQGGVQKGTFTTNQSGNTTIDLDAGGGSSTDVQINGTSITSGGVADIVTEGVYDATDNKIATMSDLDTKQDVLTTGEGITISELDDTLSIAKVTDISGEWAYLAYGNNVYVAVSNYGMVITSVDGETWINRGQKFRGSAYGITFGNGLFVVICDTSNTERIYTSSDGITWSYYNISSAKDPRGITYGGGKFVVASWQHILTSSDGENWTVISVSSGSTNWMNVAYGNGLFVAVGTNNYIMTSTDGATWSTPKQISGSSIDYTITYGNGKFIIGEQYVTTSTDGETWTTPVSVGDSKFKSIIWVENKFVAVGYRTGTYVGIITTSTDGTTWTTPVIKGTRAWRSVVAKGYDCVAIANDYSTKFTMKPVTAIYISPDSSLSSTSENAVQNKVINTALNSKVNTSRTVNGKALTSNITLATSDISNCESTTNKVTSISSSSTDSEYPTAKCMYDIVGDVETLINAL